MKKALSLLICIFILASTIIISAAEASLELYPLEYEEYMRGETLIIRANANAYFTVGIYGPDNAPPVYILAHSPEQFLDGIEIPIGTEESIYPYGEWTIIVQNGDVSDTLSFILAETVDRTDPPKDDDLGPSDDGWSPPTSNKPSGNTTVTTIIPEVTDISLAVGESKKIKIDSSASSLSVEVDDENVISASISSKVLTVTALRTGKSQLWIKTSNNHASLDVVVTAKETNDNILTEKPSEKPTEEPTEKPEEEPTEAPTEKELENPFEDIKSHWAKESIVYLYSQGIINGMDEDTFAPDDYVTRAQFVTMLTKAFKLDSALSVSPFNDVAESDWYFKSVMAAYENSIAQGDYSGNFNPNTLVTRQDMATLAYRGATAQNIKFTNDKSTPFTDHSFIKDYAVEAVYSMRSEGIINGMTETTFEPLGNATRAQAAHIIAKLLTLK